MSKKQSKLTSLWVDSDSDDCIILDDPVGPKTCGAVKKTDISLLTVGSTKKSTSWVSSSFGDFGGFGDSNPTSMSKSKSVPVKTRCNPQGEVMAGSRKRACPRSRDVEEFRKVGTVSRRANKGPEVDLWSDKYTPQTQSDLAVHKKKIEEVECWLKQHLDRKGLAPILLLTGAAGTGKTATVRVLAREMKCELHEWTNPLADAFDTGWKDEDWRSRSRLDTGPSSGSQLSQFQDFLLRANKYNTLDIFGGGGVVKRKIIFVEDFPNMFYRDAAPFHDILRKYVQVGGSPLIFIVSDSKSGESNERLLFPKDLQSSLAIHNVSYNPVAQTSMTKVLTKMATDESLKGCHKFTIPSKTVLESIAMASAGDIRGSINALQFACLKDTTDLAALCNSSKGGKPTSGKGKKSTSKPSMTTKLSSSSKRLSKCGSITEDDQLAAIGGRDTSIFLFRALGKILYCKRDEPSDDPDTVQLPTHLSHHYRDPLLVNPEDVVEKCHLSGDYFSAYLHQNYVDFYTSIEDVVCASEYLSDADYLTVDWASRSLLQQYAASIATRGIMHCNTARAKHGVKGGGLGWKPLHKPQWYTTNKQALKNCESARYLFRSYRSPPVVLQTEIIPYISLINTTLHDTGQISFMQEICRFSSRDSGRYEKLDEKDVDCDNEELDLPTANQKSASDQVVDDVISNSQSNVKVSQEVEEEYEIEDYDF